MAPASVLVGGTNDDNPHVSYAIALQQDTMRIHVAPEFDPACAFAFFRMQSYG